MVDLAITILRAAALPIIGIVVPTIFRRLFGGHFRFSRDAFFEEIIGFVLGWLIAYPVGLLVTLAVSFLIPAGVSVYSFEIVFISLLGILGGWVWAVLLRPVSSQSSFSDRSIT